MGGCDGNCGPCLKEMGRREYSGPLRPGELSANAAVNRFLIWKKLRDEGDYKQCYCAFYKTKRESCKCEPCQMCDRKAEVLESVTLCDGKPRPPRCLLCHARACEAIHPGDVCLAAACKFGRATKKRKR